MPPFALGLGTGLDFDAPSSFDLGTGDFDRRRLRGVGDFDQRPPPDTGDLELADVGDAMDPSRRRGLDAIPLGLETVVELPIVVALLFVDPPPPVPPAAGFGPACEKPLALLAGGELFLLAGETRLWGFVGDVLPLTTLPSPMPRPKEEIIPFGGVDAPTKESGAIPPLDAAEDLEGREPMALRGFGDKLLRAMGLWREAEIHVRKRCVGNSQVKRRGQTNNCLACDVFRTEMGS